MDEAALRDLIRRDAVEFSEARAVLEAKEHRERAERAVASTRDPFEAWYRLASAEPRPEDHLFHLRRASLSRTPRLAVRRMRDSAIRVALCPSPEVPSARCVRHPVSVEDAVAFALLTPLLSRAEALAQDAARALDAIDQGTFALARAWREPPARRIVWATRRADERPALHRAAVLLAVKLLEELSDGAGWRPRDAFGEIIPEGYYGTWAPHRAAAVGGLAWRAAVRSGRRVTATRETPGSRLYVREDVVGRAYADLDDPFEPLLRLFGLGIGVVGFSLEAAALSLEIRAPHRSEIDASSAAGSSR